MEDSALNPTASLKMKRSLIISPNLDALLEHEERTRPQQRSMVPGMTASASSRSISPSDEFPVGLPPPPRHPRRIKMPCSLKINLPHSQETELQARETPEKLTSTSVFVQPTSSSTSNPYINPAPTLAELLDDLPSEASLATEPSINSLSQSNEHLLEPSSHLSDSRDGSPIIFTSPWTPIDVTGEYSRKQSHPSSSRDPKLLHVSSRPFSNSIVDAPIRNPEDTQRQSKSVKPLSSAILKSDMKDPDSQTQGVNSDAWSSAAIESDRRRPPLVSHAKGPSSSSDSTFYSQEPTTTTENESRISISSTLYPPSSTHSYSRYSSNDLAIPLTKNEQNRDSQLEIYSLSQTEFDCPQSSPIQFSKLSISEYSLPFISPDVSSSRSSKPALPFSELFLSEYSVPFIPPNISKPPLPSTPKPVFYRSSMKPGILRQASFPILTERPKTSEAPLPPTTNFLDAGDRADLVRKTRKLARVFGQTPRADTTPEASLSPMSRYSSVLNDLDWPILRRRRSTLQLDTSLFNGGRRHSVPLTPDEMPFMTTVSSSFQGSLSPSSDQAGHHAKVQIRSERLSVDSLDGGDIGLVIPDKMTGSLQSSEFEEMFEEEQADEDRRRKREKLAKLHRFLGSRVPVNLVLGIDNDEASLPPPYLSPTSASHESTDRKTWSMRRRSSSPALSSPHWPDDLERVKEELNDKEKFINVRRALKMEKVFGVAPPQTLYHTRYCSPPLLLVSKSDPSEVSSPTASAPPQRNPNRSAYLKHKPKKNDRPGTSDSSKQLLPKDQQSSDDLLNASGATHSAIYNHYQSSLDSLHDILDRDDKESLVELHQYLNIGENYSSQLEVPPVMTIGRRRSLPASMLSFDTVTTPETNVTTFQVRRRKAAKLTQFFGVDYRELIDDILQSIENGVENEHEKGTLRAEEAEDLLARLRDLKTNGQSFLD